MEFSDDDFDFSKYMEDTEVKATVKAANIYAQGLIDEIENPVQHKQNYLPWHKADHLIQFRPGEVTIWGGENGSGKSLVTGQLALSLCSNGERVCIASFEMKPIRTIGRMGRQATGMIHNDLLINSNSASKAMVIEQYTKFRDWLKNRMWFYNRQGTVNWQNVVAMCKYAARELKCSHIFVDNLGKCVQGEDDYNGQKAFIDHICAVARDEDIHIHVVHHVRKPEKEGAQGNKYSFKGTGAITDQPDNVIIVWRNKAKEHNRGKDSDPDALLIVDKQRNGEGNEGEVALWYDRTSQQYVAGPNEPMQEFM